MLIDSRTRFVDKNKRVPYAYTQRAKAYLAFGREKRAIQDLEKAIRLSGKGRADPDLYFLLAGLYAGQGNAGKVLRLLKEADPTDEELRAFRKRTPALEPLLKRHLGLRKLFR